MISLFYPHLPEDSGAEAHRLGLIQGFRDCGVRCVSRNQFSRWSCLCFVVDAFLGRVLYIRMNANSRNFRNVMRILHWFRRDYILEVNAPHLEDNSSADFYENTVRRADNIVCVSSALKSYIEKYNKNVFTVSNGGVRFGAPSKELREERGCFLFVYNANWPWQSARGVNRIATALKSYGMILKVVDVVGCLKPEGLVKNVEVVPALTRANYLYELESAAGFYLEYNPTQDMEIGFYGDSLKFRDYWNSSKPIVVSGPLMHWAPNAQTAEFGVYQVDEFLNLGNENVPNVFVRKSYTWEDACKRILSKVEKV